MPDLYCPECHKACGVAECPTTAQGVCKCCGKTPVAWADRNKPWMWCTDHQQWHDQPCAADAVHHCCTVA